MGLYCVVYQSLINFVKNLTTYQQVMNRVINNLSTGLSTVVVDNFLENHYVQNALQSVRLLRHGSLSDADGWLIVFGFYIFRVS